ncbi:MAG TPA: hypothetical protein VF165_04385 [Nocardioidaceae bacterium]
MMVSLRLANVLLVCMSVLFALSLRTNLVFVLDAYFGMLLAGQLVGAATRPEQRPRWVR